MSIIKPQRVRLSRAKGFNLQEASRAENGLPAINVTRAGSGRFGNPFVADQRAGVFIGGEWAFLARRSYFAADIFRWWLAGDIVGAPVIRTMEHRRKALIGSLDLLRGKNLACWCKPGMPCHADVLLEIANR